ncbi:hypothetical protein BSLA_02f2921 [Burkholderia stabilis]|nr:hypothetical protein BSLA_02f2921 [Burkholderia stabilis]
MAGGRGLTVPARYMHGCGIILSAMTHCARNNIRSLLPHRPGPPRTDAAAIENISNINWSIV